MHAYQPDPLLTCKPINFGAISISDLLNLLKTYGGIMIHVQINKDIKIY